MISAIVDDAEQSLSGEELDAVYGTSSVAVDSHDYWVNQGGVQITVDSLNEVYNGCITSPNPNECLWETALPDRSRVRAGAVIRLVSAHAPACSDAYSVKGIIKSDFLGAAAGWFVGGPGGIVVGGLSGSAMESLWQTASFLACLWAY